MRDVIYLVVSPARVERMTKNLPQLSRGEIPVKLAVSVASSAFREPVIERAIEVTDWREGIDLADIDFREAIITEAEAEQIRAQRLARMRDVLTAHGYTITDPEPDPDGTDG